MYAAENDAMAHLAITGHRRPENEYFFSLTLNLQKCCSVSQSRRQFNRCLRNSSNVHLIRWPSVVPAFKKDRLVLPLSTPL